MTYEITGTPTEITVGFEQFLQELAPEKPQRNHMVMVAEHSINALRKDNHSVHRLTADVDVATGTINITLVLV